MLLVGQILLLLIIAWFVVCIVNMMTKRWIAFIIVIICMAIYAGAVMLFQPAEDRHDPQHHDHKRCK